MPCSGCGFAHILCCHTRSLSICTDKLVRCMTHNRTTILVPGAHVCTLLDGIVFQYQRTLVMHDRTQPHLLVALEKRSIQSYVSTFRNMERSWQQQGADKQTPTDALTTCERNLLMMAWRYAWLPARMSMPAPATRRLAMTLAAYTGSTAYKAQIAVKKEALLFFKKST